MYQNKMDLQDSTDITDKFRTIPRLEIGICDVSPVVGSMIVWTTCCTGCPVIGSVTVTVVVVAPVRYMETL